MRAYALAILLLFVTAFCFATTLVPWHQSWEGGRTQTENLIQVALGDSRQLFARHFFLKADAYFHSGYYPTIYDRKEGDGQVHIAEKNGPAGESEEEINFLGPPRDWIDAFSRNFFPSKHTHLGESKHTTAGVEGGEHQHDEHCQHHEAGHETPEGEAGHEDHEHEAAPKSASAESRAEGGPDEREMLPWLKLSLEMDPKRVQTYVVASFWLRTKLNQADEAERLLRDGLRQVPGDPELLFELGRVMKEERKNPDRARNVWELGLKNWNDREMVKDVPNFFIGAQILGNLATLEEEAGNKAAAIRHLERLQIISPNKDSIAKWIETLRTK